MELNELTQPYTNPYFPEEDIGLMTKDEFMDYRNPMNKNHPDSVYDATIESMNRADRLRKVDLSYMLPNRASDKLVLHIQTTWSDGVKTDKDSYITYNDKPVAAILDNVYYYSVYAPEIRFPIRIADRFNNDALDVDLSPKEMVKVKYIQPYIDRLHNIKQRNLSYAPSLLKQFKIDGESLSVRTTSDLPYEKNSGKTIVILNQDGMIVANASDEWGATLLQVAREYRGKGLGKFLGGIWYHFNPSYTSGGFSPSGQRNSLAIWSDRVRHLMSTGGYSYLIKKGEISPEKVKQIISKISDSNTSVKKLPSDSTVNNPAETSELLVYLDQSGAMVIYDRKFFDQRDEKYVYAHGFIREANGKPYIFTLDYDPKFKKIATYIMFQLAYNLGIKLYIQSPPSDHLELDGLDGIKIDGDYAYLTEPAIDLKPLFTKEHQLRKQLDPYQEVFHSLLEIANSKWI